MWVCGHRLPESSSSGHERWRILTHVIICNNFKLKSIFPFLLKKFDRKWGIWKSNQNQNKQHQTHTAEDTDILNCKSNGFLVSGNFIVLTQTPTFNILSEPCLIYNRDPRIKWHIRKHSSMDDTRWILLSSGLKCLLLPLAEKISALPVPQRVRMVFERLCRYFPRTLGMDTRMEIVNTAECHSGVQALGWLSQEPWFRKSKLTVKVTEA